MIALSSQKQSIMSLQVTSPDHKHPWISYHQGFFPEKAQLPMSDNCEVFETLLILINITRSTRSKPFTSVT